MPTALLTSKPHILPPRPGMVQRPHLVERLSVGLPGGARKLTLISAPPVSGKTTLLSEWVHTMGIHRDAPLPRPGGMGVAWLTLDQVMKYVAAFLLVMHGLAHVTGILGAWASGEQGFQDEAWIFSGGITERSVVGQAWSLLWLVTLIGFVGAGLGLLFGSGADSTPWWPTLAIAAAAISLVTIVPWVRVVPPGAYAGALLDLLILAAMIPPWSDQIVAALR